MDQTAVDDLPIGVVRLDAEGRVVGANAWFRAWVRADQVVGTPLRELLVTVPDFLVDAGRESTMMVCAGDPERAALVVRRAVGGESVMTVMDASDRYAAGRRLRASYALADRTKNRLQLVIDSSIAFATATSEERLAEILAATAARAYGAEEAAVFLFDESGRLYRAAGTNPLDLVVPEGTLAAGVRQLRRVVTARLDAAAEPLSPVVSEAMERAQVHAVIAAPLSFERVTFGVFACFFHHEREFDDEAAPLAEALAGQAARALSAVRLQRRLEHAAMHDEITNLPNRRRLDQIAWSSVEHPVTSVIFVDLDGFKEVNDNLGHDVGDLVLCEVARRLEANVRDGDVVARYGGDEFVVVCDADENAAIDIAERVRHALSEDLPFLPPGHGVGASVGVATAQAQRGALGIDRLIRSADQAMYLAKGQGGNRVAIAGASQVDGRS